MPGAYTKEAADMAGWTVLSRRVRWGGVCVRAYEPWLSYRPALHPGQEATLLSAV